MKETVSKHYPGREVPLDFGGTIVKASVYPVGVKEFRKFTQSITRAVGSIANLAPTLPKVPKRDVNGKIVTDGAGVAVYEMSTDAWLTVGPLLTDIIISDLLDLVGGSTKMPTGYEFDDLRHWHLPQIITAWVGENFDSEEKLNPWVQAVAMIFHRLTGETLETSSLTSALSSLLGSVKEKSSTNVNSDTTENPSPMLDGQSLSSGTT